MSMTVSAQTPFNSYAYSGSSTFVYSFLILTVADLVVTVDGTVKTYGVDYSVSGVGSAGGGSVTYLGALTTGQIVTLQRLTARIRSIDYQTNGDLPAADLNKDLDRLWMALQEQDAVESTAIRVPVGETTPALPSASVRASRLLGFDSSGNVTAVLPTAGDASSLALDLASTGAAAKGAGQIGYSVSLSYASGSVGYTLKALAALTAALPWANITGKPTTASGYGLTDVASLAALNVLDNPAFNVNQRGYVSGAATTGANQVTLDRWRVPTSGQSVTFSASGAGNTVTFPASGGEQIIRAGNIRGGTYTVAWTGAGTCTINGTTAANGSQVTLPANTQVSIKFFGVVGEVMLVPGSATGPFVLRPYAEELRRCQVEYVQELFYFARYGQAAGTWSFSSGMMPVTMGATPSMGFVGAVNYGFCSGGAINVDGPRSYHMTATVASASEFNMSGTYYASTGI